MDGGIKKGDLVKFKLDNQEFSGIVQETTENTIKAFVCCSVLGNRNFLIKKADVFKVIKTKPCESCKENTGKFCGNPWCHTLG